MEAGTVKGRVLPVMAGSSFSAQSRALVRKSWAYQSRKRCQNICLLFLPLLFMGLLAVLQSLINDAIKNAGLTCADATWVEATCVAPKSCLGMNSTLLVAALGECEGDVSAANLPAYHAARGQVPHMRTAPPAPNKGGMVAACAGRLLCQR